MSAVAFSEGGYDLWISMWMSPDPILGEYLDAVGKGDANLGVFNAKNLALYTYCHQNPLKYVDPDGNAVFLPALYVAATSAALYLQTLGASVDTAMDIADTGQAFKEGRLDEGIVGAGAILVAGFTAKSGMDAYGKGKKALGEGAEAVGKKIEKVIKDIADYLGEGAKGRKNKAGNLILQSKDEMKQIRFDIKKTDPHKSPYVNIEEYKDTP